MRLLAGMAVGRMEVAGAVRHMLVQSDMAKAPPGMDYWTVLVAVEAAAVERRSLAEVRRSLLADRIVVGLVDLVAGTVAEVDTRAEVRAAGLLQQQVLRREASWRVFGERMCCRKGRQRDDVVVKKTYLRSECLILSTCRLSTWWWRRRLSRPSQQIWPVT